MNQEIGSAIWTLLRGGTALTAQLSGGTASGTASIYVDHAPNNAGLPYIVINQQTGNWDYAMDASRFQTSLWQVRAVSQAPYPKQSQAIDSLIDARLQMGTPTIGGYNLKRIVRETDIQFTEESGGQLIQNVGALYRVDVQKT